MAWFAEILVPIKEYLKDKPLWKRIEPWFTLLLVYLAANIALREYYQREAHLELPLTLYVRSYIFNRLAAVFLFTVGATIVLLRVPSRPSPDGQVGATVRQRLQRIVQKRWRSATRTLAILAVFVIGLVLTLRCMSPYQATRIRIVFLDAPDQHFDRYAFGYLLYEANRAQRDWYFEVDYKEVNPNEFSRDQESQFSGDDGLIRLTRWKAGNPACIGITTHGFDSHAFWINRDDCSVVSTADWQRYKPPSTYDFLMFSVVLQGMVIHLNQRSQGLPRGAYVAGRPETGSVWDFSQRRAAMKPALLAGHIDTEDQQLLLNCFGAEYLNTTLKMLQLDWMHTPQVVDKLRTFGVADVLPREASVFPIKDESGAPKHE